MKLKRRDIRMDKEQIDNILIKYLRGDQDALTIDDMTGEYCEIHLRNRKGWQKKQDKSFREIDQHGNSGPVLFMCILLTLLQLITTKYFRDQIIPLATYFSGFCYGLSGWSMPILIAPWQMRPLSSLQWEQMELYNLVNR